jgi:hypothetical protein
MDSVFFREFTSGISEFNVNLTSEFRIELRDTAQRRTIFGDLGAFLRSVPAGCASHCLPQCLERLDRSCEAR